jgi:hypothetical protein
MEALKQSLHLKAGFEVVQQNVTDKQIRLVGRVPRDKTGQWLLVVERLLLREQEPDCAWNLDISKQYFLRGNRLLYGWRVILQAPSVAEHVDELVNIAKTTPMVQRQLEEVALVGGTDYSQLKGGKGAQSLFKAVVGPAANPLRRR